MSAPLNLNNFEESVISDPSLPENFTEHDGTDIGEVGFVQAANVAAIATADGADAATTQALANASKAKINAILTALKAAGIMVADA